MSHHTSHLTVCSSPLSLLSPRISRDGQLSWFNPDTPYPFWYSPPSIFIRLKRMDSHPWENIEDVWSVPFGLNQFLPPLPLRRVRPMIFSGISTTWRRVPPPSLRFLFHHIFAYKNSPIGAGGIEVPGKGAVRWCDNLTGWQCGYESSSPINPTSPFRSKHLARFSGWPGRR